MIKNRLLHLTILVCATSLYGCASPTGSETNQQTSKTSTAQSDKSQKLSAYKVTTVETSNGTIEIAPTVVSTPDELLEVSTRDANSETAYSDPLEFINRPIFKFNHFTYQYALIPLAKGYNNVVPEPVQSSISNAFSNLTEPLSLVNNTLSGEFSEAGNNLARFVINSTVGLLGFFDPATSWFDIQEKPQNFSQTLVKYKVASGAFVVLPFLGQSDLRGTTSIISESFIHPSKYIFNSPDDMYIRVADGFDDFTQQAQIYEKLYEQAQDPYIYFRNQYIQSRNRDQLTEQKQSRSGVHAVNVAQEGENNE